MHSKQIRDDSFDQIVRLHCSVTRPYSLCCFYAQEMAALSKGIRNESLFFCVLAISF